MKRNILFIITLIASATCGSIQAQDIEYRAPEPTTIKEIVLIWKNIGHPLAGYIANHDEDLFSYQSITKIPEIGIRGLWLRINDRITLEGLKKLSGEPLYTYGPHTSAPNFNNKTEFGHYNIKFVEWALTKVLPELTRLDVQIDTQKQYNDIIKPIAQCAAITYLTQKLPASSVQERALQQTLQTMPTLYTLFVIPTWNNFWKRRTTDGTHDVFFKICMQLIKTYDPSFYKGYLKIYNGYYHSGSTPQHNEPHIDITQPNATTEQPWWKRSILFNWLPI